MIPCRLCFCSRRRHHSRRTNARCNCAYQDVLQNGGSIGQNGRGLRNAVYVTYPYAKAAGKVLNEVNARLLNVTDKNERKAIIKSREKDLKREFADKLNQSFCLPG